MSDDPTKAPTAADDAAWLETQVGDDEPTAFTTRLRAIAARLTAQAKRLQRMEAEILLLKRKCGEV